MHFTAVTCPRLEPPENGEIAASSLVFGSFARYFCKTGFDVIGTPLRQCLANASWSSVEPTCQRKALFVIILLC